MPTKCYQRDIRTKVVPHKHRAVKDLKTAAAQEDRDTAIEAMIKALPKWKMVT